VVSDEEKAPVEASGGDREDDCCRSIETLKTTSKPGCWCVLRDESGGCPFTGRAVSGVEAA